MMQVNHPYCRRHCTLERNPTCTSRADHDWNCYRTRSTLTALVFLLFCWTVLECCRLWSSEPSFFIFDVSPLTVIALTSVFIAFLLAFYSRWQPKTVSTPPEKGPDKATSYQDQYFTPSKVVISRRHENDGSPEISSRNINVDIKSPTEKRQRSRLIDPRSTEDHAQYCDDFTEQYERSLRKDSHETVGNQTSPGVYDGLEQFTRFEQIDWQRKSEARHQQQQLDRYGERHCKGNQSGEVICFEPCQDRVVVSTTKPPAQSWPDSLSEIKDKSTPKSAAKEQTSFHSLAIEQQELDPPQVPEEKELLPFIEGATVNQIPQALLGIRSNFPFPTPLSTPAALILDPSQIYPRLDSSPIGGSFHGIAKDAHRHPSEPLSEWSSSSPTLGTLDRLNLNDLYVFHVPVAELVRYFSIPENQGSLPAFYEKILDNIDIISASVAADLIRLPVKANYHHLELTRALCARILQFPAIVRNLTSMQIALVCWSLAKTPHCVTSGQRQGEFNCIHILNSLAEETISKVKEFEPLSIANFLWACGKLRYKNDVILKQLAEIASIQLELFNAQNIANTYWALGTLEIGNTALTPRTTLSNGPTATTVVKTLIQKLSSFNSQAVANFVWACARLQWNVPQLLQIVCHAAVQISRTFKPQEIANFMWGIAKLGYFDGNFAMEVFAERAAANLRLFNSQEVSNAYWALGTLELRGTHLTPSNLCSPTGTNTSSPSLVPSPALSTTTSSLALPSRAASAIDLGLVQSWSAASSTRESFSNKQPTHIDVEGSYIIERQSHEKELLSILLNKMEQFNSQAVANFIWACGKLQWKSLEICSASRIIIQRNIRYFRPQNTANVLWALAKLRVNDPELIQLLIDAAIHRLEEFNTQEIANTYWAIGTLELRETPLTPASNGSCLGHRQSPVWRTIKAKLPSFKPQEIANFLWSCARLRWRPIDLLEEAAATALKCKGKFKPQEVGNLVWALAKLNYRHAELLKTMCDYAAINIRAFAPQNIANIYWAIGSLTFSQTLLSSDHPSGEFLDSLIQLIYNFNPQELTNFLWSCGRLRWEIKTIITAASQIVVEKAKLFRRKEGLNLIWAFKKLGHHDVVEALEIALENQHCDYKSQLPGCFSPRVPDTIYG